MTPSSGDGPRFATVTEDDYGGAVWTVSILCAIYAVLTLTLRGYVKRKSWGLDDWLATAATVQPTSSCELFENGTNNTNS